MKAFLTSLLFVITLTACGLSAAKETRIVKGDFIVTLTDHPCSNPSVKGVIQAIGAEPYMGSIMMDGRAENKEMKASMCYFVVKNDSNQIFVVDEQGGMGFMILDESKVKK